MSTDRRLSYVARAKAMFRHALDGYMDYAFPLDELNPISCTGRSVDRADQNNWNINDVLGNFSVTLVDSLDAIYTVLGPQEFHEAVRKVIDVVSFDQDSRVQVFEVTIRMLGGLVSAHHLASTPFHTLLGSTDSHLISSRDRKVYGSMPGYNGELLKLAEDLGERLLPAFDTTTGLPFPRVHLRKGVLPWEVSDTCTAGAGTLLMEFGALSRLYNDTGYQIFEKKAKHSLEYIWSRRSPLNLLGNTIDTASGVWLQKLSGIGAGADSFYEYLLKSYILFGDDTLHKTFQDAYTAVQLYNKDEPGWFYKNVDMDSGNQVVNWVDSLSAFWPGLQVLAGDVDGAVKLHFVFWSIWNKFKAFPERYDFAQRVANIGHYPLRPELIESTYFLYQATKNPFYLEVGAQILEDLESQTKTSCGFAAMQSVGTKNLDPRMESFFLSETLKYLYLLFDTENIFNKHQTNFIYTTEGHVLPIHPISRSRNKPIPSSPSKPPIRPLTCPLPSVHFNYHLPTFTGTHAPLPISEIQAINQMLGLHTYASFNLLEEPTTCKQNHTLVVPGSPELVQESDVMYVFDFETVKLVVVLSAYLFVWGGWRWLFGCVMCCLRRGRRRMEVATAAVGDDGGKDEAEKEGEE
ncbi:hypothetical protein BCR33DRAFT_663463 [Rhizoclosmatium globosum]|uniref:alpha-1,2-Mannosidase n=1 Tax=Rhizoclosmatium globosum TaxID=329046 RepID=A0A1Y2BSF4_9FUNG|nr:hypothetical protein BCR33DRAFT_663463 [Rhizoclosmatium globosum]|eukprot:ORY37680.1 hypothetical protein BCR33DRAFT_663463 [Rhizoclosmatium globosum]